MFSTIVNNIQFDIFSSNEYFQITATYLINTQYYWSVKFTDSFNVPSKREESLIYIITLSRLADIFENKDENIQVVYPDLNPSGKMPYKLKIKLKLYSKTHDCYDKVNIILS